MSNESWVYQGRQAHGWFGSGTAPKAAPAATPSGGAPTSLAERVLWVAYGALAELPREQRARFETQLARGALDSLTTAMPAWIRSAGPDAESFRQHSFGPYSSAKASAQIQAVATAVGWTDNLTPAMDKQ